MTGETPDDERSNGTPEGSTRPDGGHAQDRDIQDHDSRDHDHGLPGYGSVQRWLVTTNHKDVGVLYLLTALFFFVFGGLLAMVFRLNMLAPGTGAVTIFGIELLASAPLSDSAFNQAVTGHGLLMIFWFISPFAFGFANYVVPLQIGADDLAFPRLNALSYWLYLSSGIVMGISFFMGGTFEGGWTMYAPLNLPMYMPEPGGTAAVIALMVFITSVTLGSVNFLTTIHRMRAEGMRMRDLPLFTMTILLTVWMMLIAFAALLAAVIILASEHILGTVYFQAQEGGSLLWAHLFWFFGHPEVYIVFFPALGIMLETFQTFSGRRLIGRKWVVASMVLIAVQSFIVWMHHMFLTPINLEVKTLFMATTIGISLPFDLIVFALIYTMVKGRLRFTTPFLFSFGALVLFIVGGITGVFLGAVVLDYEFRGTYWVVAHFHYVMLGGGTALFAGIYYWYPKITGKMYSEFLGKLHFAVYFVGFNLLYFPQFIAWDTPRRVFHYPEAFTVWHRLSTFGAVVLGASFLIMFYNLTKSYWAGEDATAKPWEYATTAEWAVSSPPPLENFPGIPSYRDGSLRFLTHAGGDRLADGSGDAATDGPGDTVTDGLGDVTTGGGKNPEANGGMAVPTAVRDEPSVAQQAAAHADHASIWPFAIGVATFLTMIGLVGLDLQTFLLAAATFLGVAVAWMGVAQRRYYGPGRVPTAVSAFGLVLLAGFLGIYGAFWAGGNATTPETHTVVSLIGMSLLAITLVELGAESFDAPTPLVVHAWPFEGVEKTKLGMWFFLASDVVVFGAIIGSAIFIRVAHGWEAWHDMYPAEHVVLPGLLNTYILVTSSFAVVLALIAIRKRSRAGLVASLSFTLILGLAFLGNKFVEWIHFYEAGWTLDENIAASTFYLTTGLHGAHVIIGLVILVWLIARAWRGAYFEDDRPVEYFGLYWHFVDIVWLFLFPLFYIV